MPYINSQLAGLLKDLRANLFWILREGRLETKNKNVGGGGRLGKNLGAGVQKILQSAPPEDFKWNSPNMISVKTLLWA